MQILGQPVTPDNIETVRRQVGLVFQDPDDQLFCPSVEEDVAFGPQQLGLSEAEVQARVQKALAQAGLADFGHRATHHLSHGEKRRACLAGVLACEPTVLVLDEPTSDLDPRGRREFKALLAADRRDQADRDARSGTGGRAVLAGHCAGPRDGGRRRARGRVAQQRGTDAGARAGAAAYPAAPSSARVTLCVRLRTPEQG